MGGQAFGSKPQGDAFEAVHKVVERWEGGYVNHRQDPGGPTNRGITQKTLERWRGRPVSSEDVRALGNDETRAIFRAFYWEPLRCPEMPAGAAMMAYNTCVLSGPRRAARLLQDALNRQGASLRRDGAVGPETIAACRTSDQRRLVEDYGALYEGYLRALPTFSVFGKGWLRRQAEVTRAALHLAGEGAPASPAERPAPAPATGHPLVLALKSQGPQVRALQLALEALKYPVGLVDGVFGSLTQGAVAAFQVANGLPGTGVVDPATWAALETAAPRQLSRARAEATADSLRAEGSRTVRNADRTWWAGLATAALGGLGALNSLLVAVGEAAQSVPTQGGAPSPKTVFDILVRNGGIDGFGQAIAGIAGSLVPGTGGAVLALVAGVAATAYSKKVIERRVEDHRSGRNLASLKTG